MYSGWELTNPTAIRAMHETFMVNEMRTETRDQRSVMIARRWTTLKMLDDVLLQLILD
jgi:hypothetical protein